MKCTKLSPDIFTIEDVLSQEECDAMIGRAEDLGFEIATINTARGTQIVAAIRNNDRVIFDDHSLAADSLDLLGIRMPSVSSCKVLC